MIMIIMVVMIIMICAEAKADNGAAAPQAARGISSRERVELSGCWRAAFFWIAYIILHYIIIVQYTMF